MALQTFIPTDWETHFSHCIWSQDLVLSGLLYPLCFYMNSPYSMQKLIGNIKKLCHFKTIAFHVFRNVFSRYASLEADSEHFRTLL